MSVRRLGATVFLVSPQTCSHIQQIHPADHLSPLPLGHRPSVFIPRGCCPVSMPLRPGMATISWFLEAWFMPRPKGLTKSFRGFEPLLKTYIYTHEGCSRGPSAIPDPLSQRRCWQSVHCSMGASLPPRAGPATPHSV